MSKRISNIQLFFTIHTQSPPTNRLRQLYLYCCCFHDAMISIIFDNKEISEIIFKN